MFIHRWQSGLRGIWMKHHDSINARLFGLQLLKKMTAGTEIVQLSSVVDRCWMMLSSRTYPVTTTLWVLSFGVRSALPSSEDLASRSPLFFHCLFGRGSKHPPGAAGSHLWGEGLEEGGVLHMIDQWWLINYRQEGSFEGMVWYFRKYLLSRRELDERTDATFRSFP